MTEAGQQRPRLVSASSGWIAGLVGGAAVSMIALMLAAYLGVAAFNADKEDARRKATDEAHRRALESLGTRIESLERSIESARRHSGVEGFAAVSANVTGEWFDGAGSCMIVREGSREREYLVKVWHCASEEPDAAMTVFAHHAGAGSLGDRRGRMAIRVLGENYLVATFRYPPPNDRHLNVHALFRRSADLGGK